MSQDVPDFGNFLCSNTFTYNTLVIYKVIEVFKMSKVEMLKSARER